MDCGKGMTVFVTNNGFDIILQGDEEIVLSAERLVDCSNQYLLDLAFRYRAGIAEKAGVFKPADAAPDNRFFTTVVPVNPAVKLTAATTDDHV